MGASEVRDRVQRIIADWLGGVEVRGDGSMRVPYGSTAAFVSIEEFGDEGASMVRVWAPVAHDIPRSSDLFEWAATEGTSYRFGSIKLFPHDGEAGTYGMVFTHNILGDYLDPEEMRNTIGMVLSTADGLDDEVTRRFGGKRYTDD